MLTRQELRTIRLLSTGATTAYIAAALEVTPGRVHALYVYIRDKTGICDLFDKKQVLAYMETRRPKKAKKPTSVQLECLRLFNDDWSFEEIATKLKMGAQTAQNHISQACKRLGILQEHHADYLDTFGVSWRWRRRELIQNYLSGQDFSPAIPTTKHVRPPQEPIPGPLHGDPCF